MRTGKQATMESAPCGTNRDRTEEAQKEPKSRTEETEKQDRIQMPDQKNRTESTGTETQAVSWNRKEKKKIQMHFFRANHFLLNIT